MFPWEVTKKALVMNFEGREVPMQNILVRRITRNKHPEEGKQTRIQLNLLTERKSETELELNVGAIWEDPACQVRAVHLICETRLLLLVLKR